LSDSDFRIAPYRTYTTPVDAEHLCTTGVMAYLGTARPDLADPMLDITTSAMLSIVSTGRNYEACEIVRVGSDMYQERATALGLRNVASCVLMSRDNSSEKAFWAGVLKNNFDIRAAAGVTATLGIPPLILSTADTSVGSTATIPPGHPWAPSAPSYGASYTYGAPYFLSWQMAMSSYTTGWISAQSYLASKAGPGFATIANAYLDIMVALWGDGVTGMHYLSAFNYGGLLLGPDKSDGAANVGKFTALTGLDTTWAQVGARNEAWYTRRANLEDQLTRPLETSPERYGHGWPGLVYAAMLGRPNAVARLAAVKADPAFSAWRLNRFRDMMIAYNVEI
jgi:hypothetical protein